MGANSDYLDRVASLGCCVCKNLGYGYSPAVIHHVRKHGGLRKNAPVIPLCPNHHTDGGLGVAVHAGKETWEAKYGDQMDLVEQVKRELEWVIL
jgi:predicted class III extradiol MEMO1 family dioxygenase